MSPQKLVRVTDDQKKSAPSGALFFCYEANILAAFKIAGVSMW